MKLSMKLSDELKKIGRATPREWGGQIVRRNKGLLVALEAKEDYDGSVGCPHCICIEHTYRCGKCLFMKHSDDRGKTQWPCVFVPFDGISLDDVGDMLPLWAEREEIRMWECVTKSQLKRAIRYLKAHIQFGHYITRWGKETS